MSEIVMWGIEVDGLISSAEFHKSFAENRIQASKDMDGGYPHRYQIVGLCRAPLQQEADKDGERVREAHEKGCASLRWNPVRREYPSCNCALPLTAIKGES